MAFWALRAFTVGCVALLAGIVTLAVAHRLDGQTKPAAREPGAEAPGGGWFSAFAGSRGVAADAERTTCNLILTARSLGVSHPVLPCGARILIQYGEKTVLTEVIDNRLKSAGRQFELTDALAQEIAIDGTQAVRWRFAVRPGG
jgi:hypothetical protein